MPSPTPKAGLTADEFCAKYELSLYDLVVLLHSHWALLKVIDLGGNIRILDNPKHVSSVYEDLEPHGICPHRHESERWFTIEEFCADYRIDAEMLVRLKLSAGLPAFHLRDGKLAVDGRSRKYWEFCEPLRFDEYTLSERGKRNSDVASMAPAKPLKGLSSPKPHETFEPNAGEGL